MPTFGGRIGTTKLRHRGRNPSLLMPTMESTADTRGCHDLLYCCGHPTDSGPKAGFGGGSGSIVYRGHQWPLLSGIFGLLRPPIRVVCFCEPELEMPTTLRL